MATRKTLQATILSFSTLESAVSSIDSLSGGRLADGLETLITNYLTDVDSKGPYCDKELETPHESERILTDALIRFAQKLLFIANNSVLFEKRMNCISKRRRPKKTRPKQSAFLLPV